MHPTVERGLIQRPEGSEARDPEHFVQFYETDQFLLKTLTEFFAAGLRAGEAAVVVATQAHREGLEQHLALSGVDLDAAGASGQYLALDAAGLLSRLLVDGLPDAGRFAEVVGGIVERVAAGRPGVRIFGEMVALLWDEGRYGAAIQLEELWNRLQASHSFVLCCAYPIDGLGGEAFATPLADVCAAHSHVVPAESYSALTSPDDRLRAIVLLQQKALRLQHEVDENARLHQQVQQELREREQLLVREQLARAEAERAGRVKDEFLATISHELRTPLTTIMGWLQRLRHGSLDAAKVARALEVIEHSAAAQARLVEDVLDVSRMIMGQFQLRVEVVDMASVVDAAIDAVRPAANAKGIRLEVTLDPSARHLIGDATRLQQVIWNLLANAIKFTPSGGQVAVRVERAGSNVRIDVSDTGEGIPAELLPFIFDRFRQADSTSTRRHGGLGLGLAIVRHLVELHGGTVHADSPGEGGGATFTILLPSAAAHARVTSHDGAAASLESPIG